MGCHSLFEGFDFYPVFGQREMNGSAAGRFVLEVEYNFVNLMTIASIPRWTKS